MGVKNNKTSTKECSRSWAKVVVSLIELSYCVCLTQQTLSFSWSPLLHAWTIETYSKESDCPINNTTLIAYDYSRIIIGKRIVTLYDIESSLIFNSHIFY